MVTTGTRRPEPGLRHGRVRVQAVDVLIMAFLSVVALTTIYPFLNLIAVSLSPISELYKGNVTLVPRNVTLDAYRYVIQNTGLATAYGNTIHITFFGIIVSLTLTIFGAYFLANKDVPGRNAVLTFIIITKVFEGGIIPFYLVVKAVGLINSRWSLIIPVAINTFWMLVMRNFFMKIPSSLSDSARIDGCSEFRIMAQIILPLSGAIVATLTLFYGVGQWNKYFHAIIFLNKSQQMPLQVLIRSMYQDSTTLIDSESLPPPTQTTRAATIMLSTLPILLLYPFLQRYFIRGITVGAIKG